MKIGKSMSDVIENSYSVSEGNILGPLLFILYINNIINICNNCKIHLFDDDTLLYLYSWRVGRRYGAMC